MNDLKPVAEVKEDNSWCGQGDIILSYIPSELPPTGTKLYAIPDTHRVVSVELLERIIIALARDNNCETAIYETLRDLIDRGNP